MLSRFVEDGGILCESVSLCLMDDAWVLYECCLALWTVLGCCIDVATTPCGYVDVASSLRMTVITFNVARSLLQCCISLMLYQRSNFHVSIIRHENAR